MANNQNSYREAAPPAKLGKVQFLKSVASKHGLEKALSIVEMPRDKLIENGYAQVWNGYYRPSKELARMTTIFERAWRWRSMRDSAAVLCKGLFEQLTGVQEIDGSKLPDLNCERTSVSGKVISLAKVNRSGRRMVTIKTDDGWSCRGSLPAKEFSLGCRISIDCSLKSSGKKSTFFTFTKAELKKW